MLKLPLQYGAGTAARMEWFSKPIGKFVAKWRGGRVYLDEEQLPVFVIEAKRGGLRYTVKIETHDEQLALGELSRFNENPQAYVNPPKALDHTPVEITKDRVTLYLESIRKTVKDHRTARAKYLAAWSTLGLDLRTVDKRGLRAALAGMRDEDGKPVGGHRGRVEALNAFCRFLVKEGDLASWNPMETTREPEHTRAAREAYSLETLRETFARLPEGPLRDLFRVRAATGLHHTEVQQFEGCQIYTGPLPERGVGIRTLEGEHEIAGVLQVAHKSGRRHRQSVDAATLAAALRLREHVPDRTTTWEAFRPIVPSNLRHSFVTLAGECGRMVVWESGGISRARIAEAVGHRAGSTMVADRYDQLQVPPLVALPLGF